MNLYNSTAALLISIAKADEIIEQKELDPTNNLKSIYKKFPESKIILFPFLKSRLVS